MWKHLFIFSGFGLVSLIPFLSPLVFSNKKEEKSNAKNSNKEKESSLYLENDQKRDSLNATEIQTSNTAPPVEAKKKVTGLSQKQSKEKRVNADMQQSMNYFDFAKTWGIRGFTKEIEDKSASIIDAWDEFFSEKDKSLESSNFFRSKNLPFYSKVYPFVFVEFPKEFDMTDKYPEWIDLSDIFPSTAEQYRTAWDKAGNSFASSIEKLYEASERDERQLISHWSYQSKAHQESLKLDKDSIKFEEATNFYPGYRNHAKVYAVSQPKYLLGNWLRDWSIKKDIDEFTQKEELSFFPFEIKYYRVSVNDEKLTVNVLKRWHNGKVYRMWIFNKEISKDIQSSKNFLLGIMSWYFYKSSLMNKNLSQDWSELLMNPEFKRMHQTRNWGNPGRNRLYI